MEVLQTTTTDQNNNNNSQQRRVSFDTKEQIHEFSTTTVPSKSRSNSSSKMATSNTTTNTATSTGTNNNNNKKNHEQEKVHMKKEYQRKQLEKAKQLCIQGNQLLNNTNGNQDDHTLFDYDEAIEKFKKAVVIQESAAGADGRYTRGTFDAYHGLGNAYYYKQDYDTCLVFYLTAIRILRYLSSQVDLPTIEGYDFLHFTKDDCRLQTTLQYNGIVTIPQIELYERNIGKSIVAERTGDIKRKEGDYVSAVKHYKLAAEYEEELLRSNVSSPSLAFLLRKIVLLAGLRKKQPFKPKPTRMTNITSPPPTSSSSSSSPPIRTSNSSDSEQSMGDNDHSSTVTQPTALDWETADRIKMTMGYIDEDDINNGNGGTKNKNAGGGGVSSSSSSSFYHLEVSQAIRIGDFLYSEFFYHRAMEEYSKAAKLVKPLSQEEDIKTLLKYVEEFHGSIETNIQQDVMKKWFPSMKHTLRTIVGQFRILIRHDETDHPILVKEITGITNGIDSNNTGNGGGGGDTTNASSTTTSTLKEVRAISETVHDIEEDFISYMIDLKKRLEHVQERTQVVGSNVQNALIAVTNQKKSTIATTMGGGGGGGAHIPPKDSSTTSTSSVGSGGGGSGKKEPLSSNLKDPPLPSN